MHTHAYTHLDFFFIFGIQMIPTQQFLCISRGIKSLPCQCVLFTPNAWLVELFYPFYHTHFNYFSFDNKENKYEYIYVYQTTAKAATVINAGTGHRSLSCSNVYFSDLWVTSYRCNWKNSPMTQFRQDEVLQNGHVIPLFSDWKGACYSLFDFMEFASGISATSYDI